jgi:hypothetical protein
VRNNLGFGLLWFKFENSIPEWNPYQAEISAEFDKKGIEARAFPTDHGDGTRSKASQVDGLPRDQTQFLDR